MPSEQYTALRAVSISLYQDQHTRFTTRRGVKENRSQVSLWNEHLLTKCASNEIWSVIRITPLGARHACVSSWCIHLGLVLLLEGGSLAPAIHQRSGVLALRLLLLCNRPKLRVLWEYGLKVLISRNKSVSKYCVSRLNTRRNGFGVCGVGFGWLCSCQSSWALKDHPRSRKSWGSQCVYLNHDDIWRLIRPCLPFEVVLQTTGGK